MAIPLNALKAVVKDVYNGSWAEAKGVNEKNSNDKFQILVSDPLTEEQAKRILEIIEKKTDFDAQIVGQKLNDEGKFRVGVRVVQPPRTPTEYNVQGAAADVTDDIIFQVANERGNTRLIHWSPIQEKSIIKASSTPLTQYEAMALFTKLDQNGIVAQIHIPPGHVRMAINPDDKICRIVIESSEKSTEILSRQPRPLISVSNKAVAKWLNRRLVEDGVEVVHFGESDKNKGNYDFYIDTQYEKQAKETLMQIQLEIVWITKFLQRNVLPMSLCSVKDVNGTTRQIQWSVMEDDPNDDWYNLAVSDLLTQAECDGLEEKLQSCSIDIEKITLHRLEPPRYQILIKSQQFSPTFLKNKPVEAKPEKGVY